MSEKQDERAEIDSRPQSATPTSLAQIDPDAPSPEVSSKKQSLSDLFTIICAGAALISDGYQNNLM